LGENYEHRTYYAATVIESAEDCWTDWECDPGAEVRVWLNGEALFRCRRPRQREWAGFPFRGKCQLLRGENLLLVQSICHEYGDANFRLQLGRELKSTPAEGCSGEADPAPVGCWFLDLVPAGEGLFRAEYLGRLGYDEEALQELGEGRSSSALLAFLDWRIQTRETAWKKLRAQVPEWAPGDISDAQRFLLEGRLHVENSEASLARLSRGTVSWREAYAPMIVAVGSHLVELEAQYPGHPWLLERRLSLLTPHLSPVEPDQLLDEELDLACELMEGLAKVHPNGWGWEYQRLGEMYWRRGRLAEAERSYRKAARYAPTEAQPWIDLADCVSDPEKAYAEALKREPERISLRDRVQQRLQALAPEQTCLPDWPILPTRQIWMSDVGFYDVCDGHDNELSVRLEETRQLIFGDGASYGYYREVMELPQARVFSVTRPKQARGEGLERSLLYRLDGSVEDTLDLAQGSWMCFHQCQSGEWAESCWLLEDPGLPGFFQEWEVGQQGRYVLVYPTHLPLFFSRAADESRVEGGWRIASWTSCGPLHVSSFADWDEVANACRRRIRFPPSPSVVSLAQQLGTVDSIRQFVGNFPEWDRKGFSWCYEPPELVLARGDGTLTERCLLMWTLLKSLRIQATLCLGLKEVCLPGPWFTKPSVRVGGEWWPAEPSKPRLEL